jgi:glycosyltransferase involved in cell wall biosynthesis
MIIRNPQNYPKVSIVIPAMNEANNLQFVLPCIPVWVHEVLLVDGRSADGTIAEARRLYPNIVVIMQEGRGKGNALRTGFDNATGDMIVMLDADGSMSSAEIPAFVGALIAGADFAKGSRFLHGGGTDDMEFHRYWGNWFFVMLVRILFGGHYSDLCYGYCAFWKYALPMLEPGSEGFDIETELYTRALRIGLRVVEVPSFEFKRRFGKSNLRAFPDGWRVLKRLLREYRRPHPGSRHLSGGLLAAEDSFTPAMNLLRDEAMHLYRRRPYLSAQAYHSAVESIKAATKIVLNLDTTYPVVRHQQAQHLKYADDMWAFLEVDTP